MLLGTVSNPIELLFFGDIVGKSGRQAVQQYLKTLDNPADVVIANAENATHGFGLSQSHYQELLDSGIDILTGGNHTWDRKEILQFINEAHYLLRPDNLPIAMPGSGIRVFDIPLVGNKSFRIGVINLIGQVFMGNYNAPLERLRAIVPELMAQTPIIFLDFHAEATAEKITLGHVAAQLGVSAMVGTHTHVQTADERILLNRMGYITDVGFNGAYHSVIGMEVRSSMERVESLVPSRLEVAESDEVQVNAIRFKIDPEHGDCLGLERICKVITLNTDN